LFKQLPDKLTQLRTLISKTKSSGRYLWQIFGHESVNRSLNDARLQDATDLVSVLQDLFRIVCVVACMVNNFNNMQLAPAMTDCMDLYKTTTTHCTENEQFYTHLLQSLRLLVPNREKILRVAISNGNQIEQRAINFAGDITADHSTWATTTITVYTWCCLCY